MDFELTEDQRAIAEMAQSVFADYCTDDRLRQFDTAAGVTCVRSAISRTVKPSSLHKIICARLTKPCGRLREPAIASSSSRSCAVTPSSRCGRPICLLAI